MTRVEGKVVARRILPSPTPDNLGRSREFYKIVNNAASSWCMAEAGTVLPKYVATEYKYSTVRRLKHSFYI